jgi:hypothetical protein
LRQDRIARTCALVALLAAVAAPAHAGAAASNPGTAYRVAPAAQPMAAKKSTSKAKARKSLRQFTGTVTELDKKSFTVEKGSKKVRTMVFVRDEKMKATGDLEKGARVTVYYREEGDRMVAHRVVVKGETASRDSGE